jgi:TetR/AcrR family transcriptional regulator
VSLSGDSARLSTPICSGPVLRRAVGYSLRVPSNEQRVAGSPQHRQRRRRPADPRRQRDPERTRQAILDAANEEFGRHGFEQARVVRIADAAGVNHQLITYHFGGKKGLYDALADRWLAKSTNIINAAEPFAEVVREYVRWTPQDKVPTVHTLVRAELDGNPPLPDEQAARLLNLVEETRKRQARGEIRDDLDVGVLTLAFFAAAIAPELMPQLAAAVTGADPTSPEFIDHYADELARVIYALATPQREARE